MTMTLDEALEERRLREALPSPPTRSALRQAAGVSQEVCAAELGVARLTFARWESGQRTPQGDNLRGYVELLRRLAAGVGGGP